MNNLGRKLSKNKFITIHALLAGLAYFAVVMRFVVDYTNVSSAALLLGIFFFPAIICGSALLLIKQMRLWRDEERFSAIGILAIANILIFLIGLVLGADIIINVF